MRILAVWLLVCACALPACKKQPRAAPPAPSAATPSAAPPVASASPPVGPIPVDVPAPPGTRLTVSIAMTELAVGPEAGQLSHFPLRADGSDDLDGFAAALPSPPPADAQAIIAADGDVPHRRVVAVLDALKQRGFTRIAFSITK